MNAIRWNDTETQTVLFFAGIILTIINTAILWRKAKRSPWFFLGVWLPPTLVFLYASDAIGRIIEDRFFHWQHWAHWPLATAGAFAIAILAILALWTFSAFVKVAQRKADANPQLALFLALQLYVALTLCTASAYSVLETRSHGSAFVGMIPSNDEISAAKENRAAHDPKYDPQNYTAENTLPIEQEMYSYRDEPLKLQLDAVYFSVVTSATVGFGDIHPASRLAKILVTAHVIFAQVILVLFVGVILANLSKQNETPVAGASVLSR
jgi:hypothetical protein